MGLMAGYGLQRWPILQDMSQFKDLYGERAGTFIANAGVQQVFGVNDFETAKWLSQMIGQETTGYQTESYRPGDPPSIGNNLTGRDLLTRMRSCSFALKTSSCGFRARPRRLRKSCATAPIENLTGCSSRRTIDPERMPPMTDASSQTNPKAYGELGVSSMQIELKLWRRLQKSGARISFRGSRSSKYAGSFGFHGTQCAR